MDLDERHEMREQARAELVFPTDRAIYCENCHEPIKNEMAFFHWHTIFMGSPARIIKTYCLDCIIPEVIAYRYKMRNVSEMTKELKLKN